MIDKVGLEVFLPVVMFATKGLVPEDVAKHFIRDACIEFCTRSLVLRRTKEITLQKGCERVPVPMYSEPDENVILITDFEVNGRKVMGVRNNRPLNGSFFTVEDGFLLSSPVDKDVPAVIRYVAVPSQSSCEVDAVLYDDWNTAIVDGALSKLLLQPYDFANPALAQSYRFEFEKAIKRARVRMMKSENTGITIAKGRYFL